MEKALFTTLFMFGFLFILIFVFVPPHSPDTQLQPTLRINEELLATAANPIKVASDDIDIYWGHDFIYFLNFYNRYDGDEWTMDMTCEKEINLTNATLFTEKKFVAQSSNERFKFSLGKDAYVNALGKNTTCTITFLSLYQHLSVSKEVKLHVVRLQKDPNARMVI